jgi:hypothetical protein
MPSGYCKHPTDRRQKVRKNYNQEVLKHPAVAIPGFSPESIELYGYGRSPGLLNFCRLPRYCQYPVACVVAKKWTAYSCGDSSGIGIGLHRIPF